MKYWGFSSFRPMQEDIIRSAIDGRDTLALLPTGGGKSLCYQVPGMAMDGLCIVVTPLIALMKDQVQALKAKGINAVGIYHGLSKVEIDNAIDNCVYGSVKFLYLSPERLTTDMMRARLEKMRVNLLAVDEAHCISQWGYDFRPPYLRISEVRELLPNTPVLALTATATRQVVEDIQEKLHFKNPNVFQKSFERKNLAYMVFREEDKMNKLLKICEKQKSTGVVYVRNRRRTREIAEWLAQHKVSADFYHAGLSPKERDAKQDAWMKERTRVIVSTNAFGMGIDKPNVRFVVHMDLPDSPEAYFQEAGRGGRDGNKAFAILLFNKSDVTNLKQFHERSYPPLKEIKKIYNCLGNYFQFAIGSGKDQSMPFDINDFAKTYKLDSFFIYNSLGFLEKEGYLAVSEALANPSRLMFLVNKEELYRFQVAHPKYDPFIKILLRSYTGLFTEFKRIKEDEIAVRNGIPQEIVKKTMLELHQLNILHYKQQNEQPVITWLEERLAASDLRISKEVYRERKQFARQRMEAMVDYVQSETKCRSLFLLAYFGEKGTKRCGQCDVCLERNKAGVSSYEFNKVIKVIKPIIKKDSPMLETLMDSLDISLPEDKVLNVIRYLKDNAKIAEDSNGRLIWQRN
ncbi:MAG: ATP-dependent DNA helicase RecQ [Bacteroidales bacterium]|nr:ATP-dependent DNA helicase RecQ [Bacteroidales bacterium]